MQLKEIKKRNEKDYLTIHSTIGFFGVLWAKKPVIQSSIDVIVYKDIENILQHKAELGLSHKQEASFVVKNEYIKRDLQALNDRTDMLPVEKKETEKK
ncbi:hypothetical protein QNH98_07415 [Myroides sp. mNGS23_01]|nr:hypothetical protein [Myroides sp. mNGS23_01]WHT40398.1 hypothetical protein QNH98_07415 [Myroides sp. mNGS23_01]